MNERERNLETLNSLLVDTFNAILKVEERSLRVGLTDTVTVTEMHILDAIGDDGVRTVTELAAAAMVTVRGKSWWNGCGIPPIAGWCGCV